MLKLAAAQECNDRFVLTTNELPSLEVHRLASDSGLER